MRHRLSKRIVTADSARASAADLGVVQREHVRHAPLGDDVDLVGVAGEVGDEGDHVLVLVQHAAAVLLLGADDVRPSGRGRSRAGGAPTRASSISIVFQTNAGRVDLPVRVRVGDADDLALVLEAEHLLEPPGARPDRASARRQTSTTSPIAAGGISASVRSWRGEKQTTRAAPAAGATRYGGGGAASSRGASGPTHG